MLSLPWPPPQKVKCHRHGSSCCRAFLKGLSSGRGDRKGSGPGLGWGEGGSHKEDLWRNRWRDRSHQQLQGGPCRETVLGPTPGQDSRPTVNGQAAAGQGPNWGRPGPLAVARPAPTWAWASVWVSGLGLRVGPGPDELSSGPSLVACRLTSPHEGRSGILAPTSTSKVSSSAQRTA